MHASCKVEEQLSCGLFLHGDQFLRNESSESQKAHKERENNGEKKMHQKETGVVVGVYIYIYRNIVLRKGVHRTEEDKKGMTMGGEGKLRDVILFSTNNRYWSK